MALILRRETDMVLELLSLTDALTDTVITTATVQATVLNEKKEPVTGATWPVTLSHVSNGTYRGILPYTTDLTPSKVLVSIVADAGAGRRSTWVMPAQIVDA